MYHWINVQRARNNVQFPTAVRTRKSFRLMLVYDWIVYQLFSSGNVYWTLFPTAKRYLEHQRCVRVTFIIAHLHESMDHAPPTVLTAVT